MRLLRYSKSRDFWQLYERARYFHDLDRDQWKELLHSKNLHTRQELKQQHRNKIVHTIVKVIIGLSFLLLSFDSDTTAGILVFIVFIAWCLYMICWCGYMNWHQRKKPEDPDEFDIEQIL